MIGSTLQQTCIFIFFFCQIRELLLHENLQLLYLHFQYSLLHSAMFVLGKAKTDTLFFGGTERKQRVHVKLIHTSITIHTCQPLTGSIQQEAIEWTILYPPPAWQIPLTDRAVGNPLIGHDIPDGHGFMGKWQFCTSADAPETNIFLHQCSVQRKYCRKPTISYFVETTYSLVLSLSH